MLRTPKRSTTQTLLLPVGTVALGLASCPAVFPAFIALYAGDALWASMVFWLLALLRPHGDGKTLWTDIVCYLVGVVLAAVIDRVLRPLDHRASGADDR